MKHQSATAALGPIAAFIVLLAAGPTSAAEPQDAEIKALRAEVTELRNLVNTMRAQLETVTPKITREPVPTEQRSAETPPLPSPPAAQVAAQSTTASRLSVGRAPLPPRDTLNDHITGASRIDNAAPPNDPHLKGFIDIPGTSTAIRIGGFAKVDAIWDPRYVGDRDQFATSSIPFGRPVPNRSTINARGTRFSLEIRRPSTLGGSLRVYVENDFYGDGESYGFKLRQAYGQLGNTYGGYGWSALVDADSLPDTLDRAGPGNLVEFRTASMRQSVKLAPGASMTLSIERPESNLSLANDQEAIETWPDIVLVGRFERPLGHFQLGGLVRRIGYRDASGAGDFATGFAVSGSGALALFGRDLLIAGVSYGEGVARDVNDLGGLKVDGIVGADGRMRLTRHIGGHAAYTHYWDKDFRSNLVVGALQLKDWGLLADEAFAQSRYGALNLIWSPSPSFSLGLEGLYGWQERQDGTSRDASRVQASIKYNFVQ